jgi:hypothetical protein
MGHPEAAVLCALCVLGVRLTAKGWLDRIHAKRAKAAKVGNDRNLSFFALFAFLA